MKKFIEYLNKQRTKFFKLLDSQFSFSSYKQLAGYTLVGIMVYNGRRPGETERLTISDFRESAQSAKENPEFMDSQKPNYIQYTRCVLRGKLSRNVSILLQDDEVKCINLILECWGIAGVQKDNPYVFGLPGEIPFKFVNAGLLLKKYAGEAELQNSDRFFAQIFGRI
ncbi:hypothetical protein JTB14_021766 [Gonioctena quinquepunctata]|nr:hypothetical protein JTB14_021766 [Gonioctena quinquepunctata]